MIKVFTGRAVTYSDSIISVLNTIERLDGIGNLLFKLRKATINTFTDRSSALATSRSNTAGFTAVTTNLYYND